MVSENAVLAACYIRVSTDDQREFSPAAQLSAIKAYADANGYRIARVYSDEGISGRRAASRPQFMQMIGDAKAGEFKTILVHKFDRFARSREDSVVFKSMLRRDCGVAVISVTESVEDDKFSVILESVLEGMAEYYSLNLSDEVKKGMSEKARRGGLQTAPPFGYRAEGNVLLPVESEADAVRAMFRALLRGQTCADIASNLRADGVLTKRGRAFTARAVRYILKNPVYTGCLRWTDRDAAKRGDYVNSYCVKGRHSPLVSTRVWRRAQELLGGSKPLNIREYRSGDKP